MDQDHTTLLSSVRKYEDLLAKDPRSCCFAPLAELYCRLGLWDEALAVVQKGVELHPEYPGGYLALGKACLGKGMTSESMTALERVVQLTPDNRVALKILGQLYRDAGRDADALGVLHRVLDLNPQDDECKAELDLLVEAMGRSRRNQTDATLEMGLQGEEVSFLDDRSGGQDVPDAYGGICPEHDELPEGRGEQGDDPLVTPTLAEMYAQQGFAEQALAIYRQLLHGDPDNSAYRLRVKQITASLEPISTEAEMRAPESIPDDDVVAWSSVERKFELLLGKIERRRACHSGKY